MDLSLCFDDNGRAHDDLTLTLAGQTWVCDSYYLALDDGCRPDAEDAAKVREVLGKLLVQWVHAVELLADGGTVFLPFDFSDQYTGWLRCDAAGDSVTVTQGYSSVEGWSFYPSDVGDLLTRLDDFRPMSPPVRTTKLELLAAIRASLDHVG